MRTKNWTTFQTDYFALKAQQIEEKKKTAFPSPWGPAAFCWQKSAIAWGNETPSS